jgi:hypothetical protein
MAFIKKGSPVKIKKVVEMKKTASGEVETEVILDNEKEKEEEGKKDA